MKKLLFMILAAIFLMGCSQKVEGEKIDNVEDKKEEMTVDEKYKAELSEYKSYESGTYKVGESIQEGEYCLISNELNRFRNSFEVRIKEFSEGEEPILDYTKYYNYYVTLKKGEYIEFSGALLFNVKDMPNIKNDITFGMLKVGKDINSGNYKIIPLKEKEWKNTNFVYFSVLEPVKGKERNAIVMNDMDFINEKKVNLKNGQYIDLNNCRLEKIE